MIEIINKHINEIFYNLVSDSKSTIKLCAPYVKQDIVNNVYANKRENVKIDVISNFSMPNFYKRSSDIEAFKTIIESQDKVYNCQLLHAKIYIFDDKYSIITSSNLTSSGFKRNLEYGVFIDDSMLVKETVKDFKNICNNENTGKINFQNIMHIENILKNLPMYKQMDFKDYDKYNKIDNILDIDLDLIKSNLNSWEKTTFEAIELINKNEFTLRNIYEFKSIFSKKYPDNNTIEASIRRNLQELRDLGLIKFLGNGKYKKLWNRA